MTDDALPDVADVEAAAAALRPVLERTPVVPLTGREHSTLLLKAECLQPTGSFKVRGAGNVLLSAADRPSRVVTASAGNMALAVAWHAARLGIRASVVVPDTAPAAKTDRIAQLGTEVRPVPYEAWWQAMIDGRDPEFPQATFVHPFLGRRVMAGNATIGLELVEQVPDLDAVVVPFGGGGLALGIAAGLRAVGCQAPVYAAEVDTASPLAAALQAGKPVEPERQPSFVDGIGGRAVFAAVWQHVPTALAGSIVVSLAQVAAALRLTAYEAKLVLEGAGGAAVAAALTLTRHDKIVAIGSGGNIDISVFGRLLGGAQE
jgi:threonine dehydratase